MSEKPWTKQCNRCHTLYAPAKARCPKCGDVEFAVVEDEPEERKPDAGAAR